MVGLIGPARRAGPEVPAALARAFARLAWPAYAVLVVTGFWNLSTFVWADQTAAWQAVLIAKIVVVAAAGVELPAAHPGHLARRYGPVGIGSRPGQRRSPGHGGPAGRVTSPVRADPAR